MKLSIFILAVLISSCSAHLIITVTTNNSEVNAASLVNIQILTNATITNNALTLTFTTDFTTQSPCTLNASNVSCTHQSTTTAQIVTIGASMAANSYYDIAVTVVNPQFASNFAITASDSGISFANTGVLTISPKIITCSISASSPFVGDVSTATLTLANTVLPANSIIVINSSLQTTFSNLFAAGSVCSSSTGVLSCTLTSSFGQQFLTINGVPTTPNLVIDITNMNNAPYNSSLISASLQIQNQNSNYMQVCSFNQPAPTSLRPSTSLVVQNWNSSVGATSNVTLTLNTYFTPFTNQLLFVYDSNFTITPLTPTTSTSTSQNSNNTLNFLGSGVAVSKSLSYLVQITNPSSQQSVIWQLYVIYSNTFFIQHFTESTLALTTRTLTVSLSPTISTTMTLSTYNISITIPYTINNGPIVTLTISYGQIQCNALNLQSNSALSVVNCSTSSLSVSGSTLAIGNLWISINVLNYFSVRGDNIMNAIITGAAPSYFSIGSGTTLISLAINSQTYTITNSNTTFATATSFTVVQSTTVQLTTGAIRKFSLSLPSDLQLASTTLTANSGSISNITVTSATNTIVVSVQGHLDITINGLSNPLRYLGSVGWNITVSDVNDNPSSFSQSSHSPSYTPTTATLSIQLTNSIIQAQSTLQVTVIPTLQYSDIPTITVTIPNSIIQSVCSTCTALSSTAFSFPYSATIMKHNITVTNSLHPNNNSISAVIASSTVNYENAAISYTLSPMALGYISSQTGFFGQLGQVNITLTSGPSTPITLSYSNLNSMLSSLSCSSCTNTQIIATGIVQFFQVASVPLTGTVNGVTYATATATVSYICASIQGCRICSSTSGTLQCQQCFTSTYTNYTLLYNNQCLQTCPIATYSNTLTCVNCQVNCQYCNSSGCTQCDLGYYVYNFTCLATCPQPLVNNATHCIPVPIICPTNCANCPLNHVCLACNSGYFLIDNSCYSSCPNGYRVNSAGTGCYLFVPPQQTSYFPFAFVISAVILSIALVAIKCYEKRSLVMGNLIAFLSVVEIGSMIMTLVYTFQSQVDLLAQALVFVLILSKILLNIIFLVYFLRVIVPQEDFQRWREQQQEHQRLYRALIVLSSVLSFQVIRIIYSRLMGLRLFFGKFNTALIFKPLNFFTIAHFCTCGAALIFLSVRNIIAQEGYKTSTFYSSVQSIVLEGLLLITCIIDNKKGYDDEFFEYQVYKVKNQYESSHIEPIEIEEQVENAGSMHEMLNAIKQSPRAAKSSQIVKNPMWVRKIQEPPGFQDAQIQSDLLQQNQLQRDQEGLIANVQQKKKKDNLFRRKIIDQWRRIEKQLPRHVNLIKKNPNEPNDDKKWVSPDNKNKISKALKRSASLQEFQVKLPEHSGSLPQRIKQYFHSVVSVPKNEEKNVNGDEKNGKRKKRQRKLNKNRKRIIDQDGNVKYIENDEEYDEGDPKVATMQVERGSLSIEAETSDRNIFNQKQGDEDDPVHTNKSVGTNRKTGGQLGQLMQRFQEQEEDDFQESISSDEQQIEDFEGENRRNRQQSPLNRDFPEKDLKTQFNSNPRLNKQIIVDYRYEGQGDDRDKKYRTKKRKVNRQTEVVYLQRLIASSDKKVRPKGRKIDF